MEEWLRQTWDVGPCHLHPEFLEPPGYLGGFPRGQGLVWVLGLWNSALPISTSFFCLGFLQSVEEALWSVIRSPVVSSPGLLALPGWGPDASSWQPCCCWPRQHHHHRKPPSTAAALSTGTQTTSAAAAACSASGRPPARTMSSWKTVGSVTLETS